MSMPNLKPNKKRGKRHGGNKNGGGKVSNIERMTIKSNTTADMAGFKVDGAILRFFRRVRALNQGDIANKLNMSTGSLNGIERGKFAFKQKYADTFMKILKDDIKLTDEHITKYIKFYIEIKSIDIKEEARAIKLLASSN